MTTQTIFILNESQNNLVESLLDDERVVSAHPIDGTTSIKVVVQNGTAESLIFDYSVQVSPSDLITQAEVGQRFNITIAAVNNAIRDGRLTAYPNPDAANPRHSGTLVSRAEADQLWSDKLRKVLVRQTRRGDWLVAEAKIGTMSVGVQKVGTPTGFTTGRQFGRFPSESEAIEFAKTIGEIVEYVPTTPNQQFVDLPKLYPQQEKYNTLDEATRNGWLLVNPDKTIEWYKGHKIVCVDVTPGRWFGENYAIVVNGHGEHLAESSQVWVNQPSFGFTVRFRTGDVVDAVHKARRLIDGLNEVETTIGLFSLPTKD